MGHNDKCLWNSFKLTSSLSWFKLVVLLFTNICLELVKKVEKNQRKGSKSSSRGRGQRKSVKRIFVTEHSLNIENSDVETDDKNNKIETMDDDYYNKYSLYSSASLASSFISILISNIHFLVLLL